MAVLRKLLDSLTDANNGRWKTQLVDSVNYLLTVEDWHEAGGVDEPPFKNSWVNSGTTVTAFYKDPFNRVYLKGTLDTGLTGTVAFTLPVGYRPSEELWFTTSQTAGAAGVQVSVGTNGDVTITYTGAAVHLNNISFRV